MSLNNHATAQNKKLFIQALMDNRYNITDACKAIGIGRRTYYDWVDEDPQFVKDCEEAHEAMLDWIEGLAKRKMEKGSDKMIELYLKTMGKKRGFGEEKVEQQFIFKIQHGTETEEGNQNYTGTASIGNT